MSSLDAARRYPRAPWGDPLTDSVPSRSVCRPSPYSPSTSLSSAHSLEDVQLVLAPSVAPPAGRAPPRSSSSSPSPPRERRHPAAPRTNPRAVPPPPPPASVGADEQYGRQRRLKAGRRTSADVLATRRQQQRGDSDSESSDEVRAGRDNRLKGKARRGRLPEKSFEEVSSGSNCCDLYSVVIRAQDSKMLLPVLQSY